MSKLGFEFSPFCHPELVSGSQRALFSETLNQVQHDIKRKQTYRISAKGQDAIKVNSDLGDND